MDVEYNILPVFKPIAESDKTINFIQGGRGSGKTTFIAGLMVLNSFDGDNVSLLCCRATATSIENSLYKSIKNAINELGLTRFFTFLKTKIVNNQTNSEFIFYGLTTNIESVQSVERVKYLWIDEAHAIKKDEAFQILIPTVRVDKDTKTKIYVTYNPRYPNDPVETFKKQWKNDSIIVIANYKDNKYFPDDMDNFRNICLKYDSENYDWIWLGKFKNTSSGNNILPREQLLRCIDAHKHLKYTPFGATDMGVDIADGGKDNPAYAIRQGSLLLVADELKKAKDCYDIAAAVIPIARDYKMRNCYYDSAGVGAGFKSECRHYVEKHPDVIYGALPFSPKPFLFGGKVNGKDRRFDGKLTNGEYFAMQNVQAWWNLRLRMHNTLSLLDGNTLINTDDCLFLKADISNNVINQLSQAEFVTNEQDKIKVIKDPNNFGSPDIADAIVMSYAYDIRNGIKANYV